MTFCKRMNTPEKVPSTVPHLRLLRFEYQKIKLPFSYQIYTCQGNLC